jgi:hypothetical protein
MIQKITLSKSSRLTARDLKKWVFIYLKKKHSPSSIKVRKKKNSNKFLVKSI